MLTSGEALYQLSSVGAQARYYHKETIQEEFWSFLEQDFRPTPTVRAGAVRQNIAVLRARKTHCADLTLRSVRCLKEGWLQEVALRRGVLLRRLLTAQQQSDTVFMKVVLAYHRILLQEMDGARRRAHDERQLRTLRVHQADVEREIRTFAVHLRSETRGRVALTHISDRSPQFERCERAVLDNVDPTYRTLLQHVSVLNVFKLQNSWLAEHMSPAPPSSSSRPPVALTQAGKIKGLFCCMSPQRFHSFAVFGLHCQRAALTSSASRPARRGQVTTAGDGLGDGDEGEGGAGEEQRKRALREKCFPTTWHSRTHRAGTGAGAGEEAGSVAATLACSQALAAPALRFSRWSCLAPAALCRALSDSDLDPFPAPGGASECFLALCRVRIVHQKTVAGPLSEEDIQAACALNFDAVFSSETQEYVLLQPRFVLPEFFMQVHFSADYMGSELDDEPSRSRLSLSRPLPSLLRALSPLRRNPAPGLDQERGDGALWRTLLRHPLDLDLDPAGLREGDASPLRSPGAAAGEAGWEEPYPSPGPGGTGPGAGGTDKLSHRRAQRQKQVLVLAVQEEVNRFREMLRGEVLRQSALPRHPNLLSEKEKS